MLWHHISEAITIATGKRFTIENRHSVTGGDINEAYCIEGGGHRYFVKLNRADRLPMFEAEAEGLAEIARTRTVRVPEPVCSGSSGDRAWLALEWIEFGGRANPKRFGEQLAALHNHTAPRFGWHRDNTLGSSPQVNTPMADWVDFWREQRLGFQLRLAARNGYRGALQAKGERLMTAFPALFDGGLSEASLMHGDLWSGNCAADRDGRPVIFDPAVYYGDREADLAMTELFGGLAPEFYRAYATVHPFAPNYPLRKVFYNLYHVLNHLNLFGGGYGDQAEAMMDTLLNALKR